MDFNLGKLLVESFIPVFKDFILPLMVWTVVPAFILKFIFKSGTAWTIGAFAGAFLCFYIGPLS